MQIPACPRLSARHEEEARSPRDCQAILTHHSPDFRDGYDQGYG